VSEKIPRREKRTDRISGTTQTFIEQASRGERAETAHLLKPKIAGKKKRKAAQDFALTLQTKEGVSRHTVAILRGTKGEEKSTSSSFLRLLGIGEKGDRLPPAQRRPISLLAVVRGGHRKEGGNMGLRHFSSYKNLRGGGGVCFVLLRPRSSGKKDYEKGRSRRPYLAGLGKKGRGPEADRVMCSRRLIFAKGLPREEVRRARSSRNRNVGRGGAGKDHGLIRLGVKSEEIPKKGRWAVTTSPSFPSMYKGKKEEDEKYNMIAVVLVKGKNTLRKRKNHASTTLESFPEERKPVARRFLF